MSDSNLKIKKAGIELTMWVFYIILGVLITLGIGIACSELYYNHILSIMAQGDGNITQILTEKKEFRAFTLSLLQLVLINVMLPVLTALLGYIFGTKDA